MRTPILLVALALLTGCASFNEMLPEEPSSDYEPLELAVYFQRQLVREHQERTWVVGLLETLSRWDERPLVPGPAPGSAPRSPRSRSRPPCTVRGKG